MLFYNATTKDIYPSEEQARAALGGSRVSLPANISLDVIREEYNVYPYEVSGTPTDDPYLFEFEKHEPVLDGDVYKENWVVVPRNLSQEEKEYHYKNRIVQGTAVKLMDEMCRSRGYDNMATAVSYSVSSNEQYRKEAARCAEVRDSVWDKAFQIIADIEANDRQLEITPQEVEAELAPLINWGTV